MPDKKTVLCDYTERASKPAEILDAFLCYFLKIDIFCFFDRLRVFREKGISRKRKIFNFWLKLYTLACFTLYFQTTYYKNVVSLANIEVFCSAWQFVLQSP